MSLDNFCNTGLELGLGFPSSTAEMSPKSNNQRPRKAGRRDFEPSLTLGICSEIDGGDRLVLCCQESGTSSFSNASVKRERKVGSEEGEIEEDDDDGSNINVRKKLRLNKDQSAVLEESFKLHSTLNPKQKQELARDLNLRPRQVEVWFQNRRARTKLKQTEMDCEYLKKCCENLTDENRRLQKELQELKVLKLSQPYYMQLPAASLSMCPSCERISGDGSAKNFLTPFTNNPSAAC